ncbi:hypothetical protein OG920_33835 [Streptomyces europaeiscabiei]|uniref:hypothetical protein n=1 Tax=Streptomyces europaeiscabiei TaxID=146819 RepID=UPI0029C0CFAC|nr:hypothetical protein [Streptomyces europaeiscabiei]
MTGVLAAGALRDFLDHMAGVIALVALSAAVMPGLATALRGLLSPWSARTRSVCTARSARWASARCWPTSA